MLSHLNEENQPEMVDITGKVPSARTARAAGSVTLPPDVLAVLESGEIETKKGPVFATARLAGTMAAKRTSELIPLCHPIGLDKCGLRIWVEDGKACIEATCAVVHKTGVEMEALTAVSVAALTIYDMCKAISPAMVIGEIRLLEKTK